MDSGPILAIDTSGATASVAVYQGRVLAEATWQSGRRHSAQLLRVIDIVMELADVDKGALSGVAVAAGPGSYSGLRVGISTAMALALALDIPVVQVPTLEALAWSLGFGIGPVRAAIEVGRGRYATVSFLREDDRLTEQSPIENLTLADLLDRASEEGSLLVVDVEPATRENAERDYHGRLRLPTAAASARRAGYVAELAGLKRRPGDVAAAGVVEPIYLA